MHVVLHAILRRLSVHKNIKFPDPAYLIEFKEVRHLFSTDEDQDIRNAENLDDRIEVFLEICERKGDDFIFVLENLFNGMQLSAGELLSEEIQKLRPDIRLSAQKAYYFQSQEWKHYREAPKEVNNGFSTHQLKLLSEWLQHFHLITEDERDEIQENPTNSLEGRTGKIFEVIKGKLEKKYQIVRGNLFPTLILRLLHTSREDLRWDLNRLAHRIISREYKELNDWDDQSVEAHGNVLGEGSWGVVCTAYYAGEIVAVKTTKRANMDDKLEQRMRKTFEEEFENLKKLKHPNIVSFPGVRHEPNERPFFVMEYVGAGTLERFWTEPNGRNFAEKIDFETKLHIARQIWCGVAYLHSSDSQKDHIAHKDIKPGNVLVTFDYTVKLCDFGFSRILSDPTLSRVSKGACFTGTERYNPPEIWERETAESYRLRDAKVDIWMAGMTILHLLCKQYPFDTDETGDERNQVSNLFRLATGPIGIMTEVQKYSNDSIYNPFEKKKIRSADISKDAAQILEIDNDALLEIKNYYKSPQIKLDLETLDILRRFFGIESMNPGEYASLFFFENFPAVREMLMGQVEVKQALILKTLALKPLQWRYRMRPKAKEVVEVFDKLIIRFG